MDPFVFLLDVKAVVVISVLIIVASLSVQRTRTDLAVVRSANTLILGCHHSSLSALLVCLVFGCKRLSAHKKAECNVSRRMLLTGIHPASGAATVPLSRWLDADNLIQFMLHGATGGMDCYGVDPSAINLSVLSPQTLALLYQLQ